MQQLEAKYDIAAGDHKTGAKIFPDLLNKLLQCRSKEIKSYLKEQLK